MNSRSKSGTNPSSEEGLSEATSKKTLSDIESSKKDSGAGNDEHGAPSPDGQVDKVDERKDTGPM